MELFYNSTGKVTRSPARLSSVYSVKCSCWFDIHMNIDKFPLVKYPVLVIHGYVNNLMQGRSYSSQWRSLCKLFSSIGSIQCLVIAWTEKSKLSSKFSFFFYFLIFWGHSN